MSDTTTAPAAADAATQAALERLNTVIDRLIAPDGCPWDSTQTPESLTEYVIEECHELVDAIRSGKTADMVEELGDVAFLILMIGKLMARAGGPSLADALEVEAAKMVRRHPHVFSDTTYENQSEQLKDWDRIKREEKAAADAEGPKGTYDSLPRGLPPLTKAYRIHSKADRVGFTWPENEDVEKQVEAEWLELLDAMESDDAEAIEHEFGDHMFTLVELGRRKGIKAGLCRPKTLWPFPKKELCEATKHASHILDVEMSMGQMIDDVRLATECRLPVSFFGRTGGVIPTPAEVLAEIEKLAGGAE